MTQIPSYKFLPLMYQLAARMGTKMATGIGEDTGFHSVLNDVIQYIYLYNIKQYITGFLLDTVSYKQRFLII